MEIGIIITVASFGMAAFSGLIVWLLKIEKANINNVEQSKNIVRIEREVHELSEDVKDVDVRVRKTEVSMGEIKSDTKHISRNIEAIFTILDNRRSRGDDDQRR